MEKRTPADECVIKRYNLNELTLRTPDIFTEKKLIGEGTFGKVYKATIGNTLYALKRIKVEQ